MFEEVPRERRGLTRLLPVRRVVLGPFVFGGGMLLAALGGSVAVAAAAATMITASAISSNDVPPRPAHQASSASSQQTLSARRPPVHHQPVRPTTAGRAAVPHPSTTTSPSGTGGPSSTSAALPAPARTMSVQRPARTSAPTAAPSSPTGAPAPTPTPSSSAPLGNAVIHVSGYRQASRRLVYQFASVQHGAGIDGGDLYRIIASDTFSAALAPSITITSGGTICPPAGSSCTVDQLIGAADSGFFAVVAIDARGELRSVVEVGDQSAAVKLAPAPSASPTGAGNHHRGHPGDTSPAPSSSPGTGS